MGATGRAVFSARSEERGTGEPCGPAAKLDAKNSMADRPHYRPGRGGDSKQRIFAAPSVRGVHFWTSGPQIELQISINPRLRRGRPQALRSADLLHPPSSKLSRLSVSSDLDAGSAAAPGQLAPGHAPAHEQGYKPIGQSLTKRAEIKSLPTPPAASPAEHRFQARASALENSAVVFQRNRREVGFESIFAQTELGQSFAKSLLLRKLRSPVRQQRVRHIDQQAQLLVVVEQ